MKLNQSPSVVAPSAAKQRFAERKASMGTAVSPKDIGQIGSVADRGQLSSFGTIMPDTITAVLDNSGGASAKSYLIFDPEGIVKAVISGTYSAPTWGSGISDAVLRKFFATSPVVFKGFNYRVTTGTQAQYSQSIKYHKVQIDGASQQYPLNVAQYIRNTQQSQTVQTIEAKFSIDQLSALSVTVEASTAVALDFYIHDLMNVVV